MIDLNKEQKRFYVAVFISLIALLLQYLLFTTVQKFLDV